MAACIPGKCGARYKRPSAAGPDVPQIVDEYQHKCPKITALCGKEPEAQAKIAGFCLEYKGQNGRSAKKLHEVLIYINYKTVYRMFAQMSTQKLMKLNFCTKKIAFTQLLGYNGCTETGGWTMAEKVATFGQRLREGLDRQGITQTELARRSGIS